MLDIEKRRLERLNVKLAYLLNQPTSNETDIDKLVAKIKEAEAAKKHAKIAEDVERVNRQHAKRRKTLKALLALEMPKEDITKNDCSFHAVKGKKVKGLSEIIAKGWTTAEYNAELQIYPSMKTQGETFIIMKPNYSSGSNITHIPFESFEQACEQNGIKSKPVKLATVLKNIEKLKIEGEKMKKFAEAYSDKVSALDAHFLNSNGIVSRFDERGLYTYKA